MLKITYEGFSFRRKWWNGRFTSRAISSLEGISSITIADLNAKAVEAFANSLKVAK